MEKKIKENYTLTERETFLAVMEEFRSVIDDKRIDAPARERKEAAWSLLLHKYNQNALVSNPRTKKQLQVLWKNMKAHAKRKRYAINATGSATKQQSRITSDLIKLESTNEHPTEMLCEDIDKSNSYDDEDFDDADDQSDISKDLPNHPEITITEVHSEATRSSFLDRDPPPLSLIPKYNKHNFFNDVREFQMELQRPTNMFYTEKIDAHPEINKKFPAGFPIDTICVNGNNNFKNNFPVLVSKNSQTDDSLPCLDKEEQFVKMELYKIQIQGAKLQNEHLQEQINSTKAHMQQIKIEHEMRLVELTLRMDLARAELDVWKLRKQNLTKDKQ